ncbi:MAG TPA: hypothetical protein VIX12_05130, partial [Candidatus Binataceae bacterium]
ALAGNSGVAEAGSESIDERTAASEFVFLNLRLREGFDLDDFRERFNRDFGEVFGAQSDRLIANDLLVRDNGRIFLSERGLEMADSVFAEFV